jgi:hypothetical protein
MRLQELFETTTDDRNISQISTELYSYLQKNFADTDIDFDDNETYGVGRLGEILDLPSESPFRNVPLVLKTDEQMTKDVFGTQQNFDPYNPKQAIGAWEPNTRTIELNIDFLGSNKLKTTISHELRHALDDIKSGGKASTSTRYSTPKKKEHRKPPDGYESDTYLAMPAEINARTMEIQQELSKIIPMVYKKLAPEEIKPRIRKSINDLLLKHQIAILFPERTASKDYKRILSRLTAYANEEMKDIENKQPNKIAQGNW